MNSQSIKFGETEVNKKDFYLSKSAILLDDVDVSKIIVSNKWKINDITSKFFIGYISNNNIKPLCIILPQMSGFIKYFEDNSKNMSFVTDDANVYEKYSEVWNKVKKLLKLKFTTRPIRNKKYILAKLKIFNGVNRSTFTDDKLPVEKVHYVYVAAIDIDSVLKIDKEVYLQVYLEQCKYKLKKRKPANFIDIDVKTDSDSASDSNDDN